MDTVISVVGDTNTFITAGVGIFTLYVSTDMAQQANFVTGDGFDDGTIVGQFLVVEGGGGSYSIAGAFDGSRDFLAIKQSGLEDFFVPDISAVSFDSNLDADPDDNGVGGNDPIPTNWQYDVGTPEINFPLNFYATVDGSLRFGFIPTKSGGRSSSAIWQPGNLLPRPQLARMAAMRLMYRLGLMQSARGSCSRILSRQRLFLDLTAMVIQTIPVRVSAMW
jgi:hypothetical protein